LQFRPEQQLQFDSPTNSYRLKEAHLMARGHGRILTSIWEDSDFLALTEDQQRLYLFLISQPNLNHAGLLDLTLRRWARKAAGLTVAELKERIDSLAKARFIVVDEDTEELLIRSFVRNDGVWRMPKVMGSMVSGALEISSPCVPPGAPRRDGPRAARRAERRADEVRSGEARAPRSASRFSSASRPCARRSDPHSRPPASGFRNPLRAPSSGTPSDTPAEGGSGTLNARARGRTAARGPCPCPCPCP
jgi:hypothetical protein